MCRSELCGAPCAPAVSGAGEVPKLADVLLFFVQLNYTQRGLLVLISLWCLHGPGNTSFAVNVRFYSLKLKFFTLFFLTENWLCWLY